MEFLLALVIILSSPAWVVLLFMLGVILLEALDRRLGGPS